MSDPSSTISEADAMKTRAETAVMRPKYEGLDGGGWVEAIRRNPARSLPGGAGWLVVEHFQLGGR